PLHTIKRQNADGASFADKATGLTTGLQADTRGLIADFQHHSQPPGCYIGQCLDLGEFHPPVARNVDLRNRATPPLRLVITNEPFCDRVAGEQLQLGGKRGGEGRAALLYLLLPVPLVEFAPTLLVEVLGSENVPAGTLRCPPKRRSFGFFGVGGVHKARLSHAI